MPATAPVAVSALQSDLMEDGKSLIMRPACISSIIGWVFIRHGSCRLDDPIHSHEQALAIDREGEDSTGIVLGLVNKSRNALMQGNLAGIRSRLAEAAQIADETHLREYMQYPIEVTAVLRFALGEHLEGARLFGAAQRELREKGYQLAPTDEKFTAHWTTKMRDMLGETTFSDAIAEGGKLSYEEAMAETRKWLEDGLNNLPGGIVTLLLLNFLGCQHQVSFRL